MDGFKKDVLGFCLEGIEVINDLDFILSQNTQRTTILKTWGEKDTVLHGWLSLLLFSVMVSLMGNELGEM